MADTPDDVTKTQHKKKRTLLSMTGIAFLFVLAIGLPIVRQFGPWGIPVWPSLIVSAAALAVLLYVWYVWLENKNPAEAFRRSALTVIVVPSLLAGLYLNFQDSNSRAAGPTHSDVEERTVLLVGHLESPHWASFRAGFIQTIKSEYGSSWDDRRSNGTEKGVIAVRRFGNYKVSILEIDNTNNQRANERIIKKYGKDKKTLVIAGFVSSTRADEALQVLSILGSEDADWQPPTVFIPMATRTDLMTTHNPEGKLPIVRIVPKNSLQAKAIADRLLVEKLASPDMSTVAVFRELENYLYSSDLADAIRNRIEKRPNGLSVVWDGSVGPRGSGAYITDSVAHLRPDFVVFLGMFKTGVPLVRQVRLWEKAGSITLNGGPAASDEITMAWKPLIVVSDGCVDTKLSDYSNLDQLHGIIGFFPGGTLEPDGNTPNSNRGRAEHRDLHQSLLTGPNFGPFGHDTFIFINDIIERAVGGGRLERKSLAAEALNLQILEKDSALQSSFLLGPYLFDEHGDVTTIGYEAWRFAGDQWVPE